MNLYIDYHLKIELQNDISLGKLSTYLVSRAIPKFLKAFRKLNSLNCCYIDYHLKIELQNDISLGKLSTYLVVSRAIPKFLKSF